jgi:7-keto-8-aminopelargonate synthetase-like enzyme
MHDGAALAGARGAAIDFFKHNDMAALREKLVEYADYPRKVIAVDGVYSMSGRFAPLPELVALAKEFDARLYVDDAHGLGLVGSGITDDYPLGLDGNGVVKHFGLRYAEDRITYVSGLSKSFSSMVAFLTCADETEKAEIIRATPYVFSCPSATSCVVSGLAAFDVFEEEGRRSLMHIMHLTKMLTNGARALGYAIGNVSLFPIVSVVVGSIANCIRASEIMWQHGLVATPAVYPVVPRNRSLLRFSLTVLNAEEDIRRALDALKAVRDALPLDGERHV